MKFTTLLVVLISFILPLSADPAGLEELKLQKEISDHLKALEDADKPLRIVYKATCLFNVTCSLAESSSTEQSDVEKKYVISDIIDASFFLTEQQWCIDRICKDLQKYQSLLEKRVSETSQDTSKYSGFVNDLEEVRRQVDFGVLTLLYGRARLMSADEIEKAVITLNTPRNGNDEENAKRTAAINNSLSVASEKTRAAATLLQRLHTEMSGCLQQCTALTTKLNKLQEQLKEAAMSRADKLHKLLEGVVIEGQSSRPLPKE